MKKLLIALAIFNAPMAFGAAAPAAPGGEITRAAASDSPSLVATRAAAESSSETPLTDILLKEGKLTFKQIDQFLIDLYFFIVRGIEIQNQPNLMNDGRTIIRNPKYFPEKYLEFHQNLIRLLTYSCVPEVAKIISKRSTYYTYNGRVPFLDTLNNLRIRYDNTNNAINKNDSCGKRCIKRLLTAHNTRAFKKEARKLWQQEAQDPHIKTLINLYRDLYAQAQLKYTQMELPEPSAIYGVGSVPLQELLEGKVELR